jgi:hypothetical protein
MQQVSLEACEYRKATKTLLLSSTHTRGFPDLVDIVSHHTGNVVTFAVDVQAGIDCEFWDGEECHYVPVEPNARVECLVIHNFGG